MIIMLLVILYLMCLQQEFYYLHLFKDKCYCTYDIYLVKKQISISEIDNMSFNYEPSHRLLNFLLFSFLMRSETEY
jgi:hypothetical protein